MCLSSIGKLEHYCDMNEALTILPAKGVRQLLLSGGNVLVLCSNLLCTPLPLLQSPQQQLACLGIVIYVKQEEGSLRSSCKCAALEIAFVVLRYSPNLLEGAKSLHFHSEDSELDLCTTQAPEKAVFII